MYCKEGQTLAKMSSFTHLHGIFAFSQKNSHCVHTISLICKNPHITAMLKKQKSKLNSKFHLCKGAGVEGGEEYIHFGYYFM